MRPPQPTGESPPAEGRLQARWDRLLRRERLARERLEVLAEAGKVLTSSLDYETTLRHVIELVLPLLGNFGMFDVEVEGEVRRLPLALEHPERQALLEHAPWEGSRLPLHGLGAADDAGLHARTDDAWLRLHASSAAELTLLRRLEFSSLMVLPLRYQRRRLGSLMLFLGKETGRSHTQADLVLGMELAQRAAAAVETARLFRQVQEAVRKRDEFLSVASHELKTPLTTLELQVTGLVRALRLGRVAPEETDVMIDRLDRVERQIQRLNHVIEQLLDATQLAGERLHLHRAQLDLREVVEHVARRLAPDAERAGSTLDLTLEPARLLGDRPRIDQVITNLLSNAIKYGGGKPVEISITNLPGEVRFQVTDHGIGIPPEDQARIFERFERAVSPRKYTGMGMGLWVVRQIVEAHGGRVQVISVPGVGSAFTVDLPT